MAIENIDRSHLSDTLTENGNNDTITRFGSKDSNDGTNGNDTAKGGGDTVKGGGVNGTLKAGEGDDIVDRAGRRRNQGR